MLEKRVYARTPDGHFFAIKFAGRDNARNFLINGKSVHPHILELFVSIQNRRHLQQKLNHPDFLGGTLYPESGSIGVFNLESAYTDFEYLYRRHPKLDTLSEQ